MGACISCDILVSHQTSKPNQTQNQNQNQNQNQSMGMDYSSAPASKSTNNFVVAAFPTGEKPSTIVTRPMPLDLAAKYRLSSAKFRSFGSNEDVFFESQPWLESDGDDEFFSVGGDLTPSIKLSASNTPVHDSLSSAPFHPSENISGGYKLTISPIKKRKSLSELFKEEEEEDHANSNLDTSSSDEDTLKFSPMAEAPKSESSIPHSLQHSFANSNMDVEVKKERSQKSAHHCFPRLFSVHSPNMAKKNSIVAA